MAKGIYVGVSGVARKVKSAYVGVSGVARKVTKAYVGINGVARQIFSADLFNYYGTIDPLSVARHGFANANIYNIDTFNGAMGGSYALFAGGYIYNTSSDNYTEYKTVDAYSDSLVHSTPTTLGTARDNPGTAIVQKITSQILKDNYAIFAGGSTATSISSAVDAYSGSLVKSTPSSLGGSRGDVSGASNGTYALFAGGRSSSGSTFYNTVYAYNSSLTRSTATALTTKKSGISGCRAGAYAIFAAGSHLDGSQSQECNEAEAYSQSLVKSSLDNPGYYKSLTIVNPSASTGDYAIFGDCRTTQVRAYSNSLVKTSVLGLPEEPNTSFSYYNEAVSAGNSAIFYNPGKSGKAHLCFYDNALVRTIQDISINSSCTLGYTGKNLLMIKTGVAAASPDNEVHIFTKSE